MVEQMTDEEFETRTLDAIQREFGVGGVARFIMTYNRVAATIPPNVASGLMDSLFRTSCQRYKRSMSNEMYLAKDLDDVPGHLTRKQKQKLVRTIDLLCNDVFENSYVIAADYAQGGGPALRTSLETSASSSAILRRASRW